MNPKDETDVITIDASRSTEVQKILWERIAAWLKSFSEQDGFLEWKNRHIAATLVSGLIPDGEPEHIEDFPLSDALIREHEIVSGYLEIQTCLMTIRECEHYFRKYPFKKEEITREAHLRTCCELFFGRIFQFRERYFKLLKRVQRRSKRKVLVVETISQQFEQRFQQVVDARNDFSHHKAYQDIHLNAVGLGDLLSSANDDLRFMRLPVRSYRAIAKYWINQVNQAVEQLDVFIGVLALVMLDLCTFLPEPQQGETEDQLR